MSRGAAVLLVQPSLKLLVEFLRRHPQDLLDHFRGGLELGIGVHHVEKLVGAPVVLDVVADAARLVVGDEHLLRIIRADKTAVEFGDRQQFLIAKAATMSGVMRSPHSGEACVSSWTASPSVNQRGTRWLVVQECNTGSFRAIACWPN